MQQQDVVNQRGNRHRLRVGDAGDARLGEEFDGGVGQAVGQGFEVGTDLHHDVITLTQRQSWGQTRRV